MRTLVSFVRDFSDKNKGKPGLDSFCTNTLEKMLFNNSSIESDMRALLRKSALIRKQIAEHKSLTKDKRTLAKEKSSLISALKLLSHFMNYVSTEMPQEAKVLKECIKRNESYITLNTK